MTYKVSSGTLNLCSLTRFGVGSANGCVVCTLDSLTTANLPLDDEACHTDSSVRMLSEFTGLRKVLVCACGILSKMLYLYDVAGRLRT